MRRTSAALAGAVAAVLVLAGCSDDEPASEPTNEPSASSKESTSPTSTAVAPTLPPAATTADAAGAEAFARYWFELVNYAYITGDAEALAKVALPDCINCSETIDEIRSTYAAGSRYEGVSVTVGSVTSGPLDDRGAIVTMVISESASQEVAADGSVVQTSEAAPDTPIDFFAALQEGQWRVFGIGLVSK